MEDDPSGSGYVAPISTCPHVNAYLRDTNEVNSMSPCGECKETKENWICLTCFYCGCSRFRGSHALKHYQEADHPLALSFSDLSIWCYKCEAYIRNNKLEKIWRMVHVDKFGVPPGVEAPTTHSAICNKCTKQIVGIRYKCANCADYDLCEGCYSENPHNKDHVFNAHKKDITNPKPGSFSGHQTEDEIKEIYDDPEEVKKKVKQLAAIVKASKHMVVYTGAGVSTSAKIPDYRGPQGVWTLRDKGLSPKFPITLEQAVPTPTHMALVELKNKGVMKLLVSTNVDGLHRRSGIEADEMTELHGNCYKEMCSKPSCNKEYLRNFDTGSSRNDHKTGRMCDSCGSPLVDSIINFGENLPDKELKKTLSEAKKSDLSLVLGTSMRVSPANKFPLEALGNGGKLVIVNLQTTPYDNKAHLIIREKTDKVMQLLFEELGFNIPEYKEELDEIKNLNIKE